MTAIVGAYVIDDGKSPQHRRCMIISPTISHWHGSLLLAPQGNWENFEMSATSPSHQSLKRYPSVPNPISHAENPAHYRRGTNKIQRFWDEHATRSSDFRAAVNNNIRLFNRHVKWLTRRLSGNAKTFWKIKAHASQTSNEIWTIRNCAIFIVARYFYLCTINIPRDGIKI